MRNRRRTTADLEYRAEFSPDAGIATLSFQVDDISVELTAHLS